jgi:hypothetical protein
MEAQEIQTQLDERFPEGVKVIFLQGGGEAGRDPLIVLTPRITTRQFGPTAVIDFNSIDGSRSFTYGVKGIEGDPNGGLLVQTDEEDVTLNLSDQFGEDMRETLKRARSAA